MRCSAPVLRAAVAPVLGLALTGALVGGLSGCSGEDSAPPAADPTLTATPLSGFDTGSVTVARAEFCGLVPDAAAEQALSASVESTSEYGNGERATMAPDLHDVAHEYSCSWAAADGSAARAWVFAPRVTEKQARSMVRDLRHQRGCTTPSAPPFGDPSIALVCTSDTGVEASYHGLFVDAWLSCSVSAAPGTPTEALLERTGAWCVQVASAANTEQG